LADIISHAGSLLEADTRKQRRKIDAVRGNRNVRRLHSPIGLLADAYEILVIVENSESRDVINIVERNGECGSKIAVSRHPHLIIRPRVVGLVRRARQVVACAQARAVDRMPCAAIWIFARGGGSYVRDKGLRFRNSGDGEGNDTQQDHPGPATHEHHSSYSQMSEKVNGFGHFT
jgi:hypothetical protein